MTKKEIRAELRRSACEDKRPWYGIEERHAFVTARRWLIDGEYMFGSPVERLRIFFLLVAEAM